MKKIIFLDFDGVLKRVNQVHTPEILAINELLSGYSWRSIKNYVKYEPELRKAIRKVGIPLRNAFANTAILERKICGLGVHACEFVVADEPVKVV